MVGGKVYVTCGTNYNPLDFHECFSRRMLFHEKVTKYRKRERKMKYKKHYENRVEKHDCY